ncbi:MAG: tRNA-dihydrouridine synthase family protein [Candidatus Diapherotrites archaeon]|nr:tRNA-dihydrouridine synthase family protein [Candidatus Diapherotrites archaeon]
MLAPLEDYSGSAMRSLCFSHGADLTFTEMARVEGIVRNNKPTLAKLFCADSTPVQIQLLAGRENQLEKFLSSFEPFESFKGFNLNFSCPSPNVIKQGRGCAMIKRTSKSQRIVSLIKKHFPDFEVSLKIRLGATEFEREHKVYLNSIRGVDADFFIVHAKSGVAKSQDKEDDSVYAECVSAAKENGKSIIANGSLTKSNKIRNLIEAGISGVMIGRGSMENPAIFDLLKNELGFNSPKKAIPSVSELKSEFLLLHQKFGENEKYKESLFQKLK